MMRCEGPWQIIDIRRAENENGAKGWAKMAAFDAVIVRTGSSFFKSYPFNIIIKQNINKESCQICASFIHIQANVVNSYLTTKPGN